MVAPDGITPVLRLRTEADITTSGGQKSTRRTIRLLSPVPDGLLEETVYASSIEIHLDSLDMPLSLDYVSLSASRPTAVEPPQSPVSEVQIFPNYPNPFAAQTTIPFRIDPGGRVRMTIFNMVGRRVARLLDRHIPAGNHRTVWNVDLTPSGTYRVLLEHDAAVHSRLVVVAR
jgi:hypothetical protein